MKNIKLKPWRIIFFSLALAGGLVFPIMNSTSCSTKQKDVTQEVLNRIDVASVDEQKSQLRGAYTRKLIKEGIPDAVSIATQYSNQVNTAVDQYLNDGDILNAFSTLNEASSKKDVTLMEWNSFDVYKKNLLSQAEKNFSKSASGITKQQKADIFNNLETELDKKAILAREQNLSADEFIKIIEDEFASQITDTTTKQAQIAKTGIDVTALSDVNVLLPVAIAPNDVSLKALTPGQDITSILPKLFSLNSRNNPYKTDSLPGYTATSKIISIEPVNLYKYKIVIEHSICLTSHIDDPDYKQGFEATYTIASNENEQAVIAQNLLTEANFTNLDIDNIVPYNDFISLFVNNANDAQPNISKLSALQQVFSYDQNAVLISHTDSGFFLSAYITAHNDALKTINVRFTVTNEEDKVCTVSNTSPITLSLTDAEKYEQMIQTREKLHDMVKLYKYYGDENYKTVNTYWDWCLAYGVVQTTLAVVSTGLAVTYWLCAFWTGGATISLAVGSTAQAVLSFVAVAFSWVQFYSVNEMLKKFNEVRSTPGFAETSRFFQSEEGLMLIQQVLDETSDLNDINDKLQTRIVWAAYIASYTSLVSAAFFGGGLIFIAIIFAFQKVFETIELVGSITEFVSDMMRYITQVMTPGNYAGYFTQIFHSVELYSTNPHNLLADVARINTSGQDAPLRWLQKLFAGKATCESMEKAQKALSWASPISIIVAIVSLGMSIANLIISKNFKLLEA